LFEVEITVLYSGTCSEYWQYLLYLLSELFSVSMAAVLQNTVNKQASYNYVSVHSFIFQFHVEV
jgi:hypothetical protein